MPATKKPVKKVLKKVKPVAKKAGPLAHEIPPDCKKTVLTGKHLVHVHTDLVKKNSANGWKMPTVIVWKWDDHYATWEMLRAVHAVRFTGPAVLKNENQRMCSVYLVTYDPLEIYESETHTLASQNLKVTEYCGSADVTDLD